MEDILVTSIHVVLYLSGNICQTLEWLLSIPGASNTTLETLVSYSHVVKEVREKHVRTATR
ncbi:hypothetical protein QJS04_geneDACA017553 [Acorus gramineus]|uniref:Uncharacterized protein n=1 Tax=Acorus gramineus TaxID=55184 RepID=A0AAV9BMB4_ACOGR|nr:hypothetical protein QJS04_geneDACA017553 [Acorus gramineus]